jgi:flagellar motility protein MotE (MotC chaperone)
MIRRLRDIRLIPIVLIAITALFALKAFGLIVDGGYTLTQSTLRQADDPEVTGAVGAAKRVETTRTDAPKAVPPRTQQGAKQSTKQSWAQQMFNFPDITGAVAESKSAPPEPAPKGNRPAPKAAEPVPAPAPATAPPTPPERPVSPAERAILERLAERRNELEARGRDLDMRESLLKAAEKQLEARINELRELESRVNTAMQNKAESEASRFKNLVTMYDNMKAKDAAKIFDRLDMRVLLEVASQINPRRMSDIMAQMQPEAAERLTIELALRAKEQGGAPELPKIEGKPAAN